ncbi:Z1 domain-containing protein [Arthrobacter sp. KK5.5]|uniref:Z1 domain-containing protein n=1 Tax=Arthrobacter sp. KK5.5 TaxID=3373084 RepID=UPI003EE55C4C
MPTPPPTERIYFNPPDLAPADTWWSRYEAQLYGLSPTAKASIEADSRYVLERGVLGDGDPEPLSWPDNRVRTGLVMGSVQSGKTASMLGVSALAMDHGVDMVIVLGGTRLSLWRQTYGRLVEQLDSGTDNSVKRSRRLLCPAAGMVLSEGTHSLDRMYHLMPATVKQRLAQRQPIIIVAMKQTHHLRALSDSLRRSVFNAVSELDRPVHMMVLDDEADDGSILDAVAESGQDQVYGNLKQIPRAIANLWDPPKGSPKNLFATYIAYTATPQANLLQEDHNPLAPRDFLVSLRTPLDIGHMVDTADPRNLDAPRSSTYPEPAGMPAFYTGGETFYRRGRLAGLCRPATNDPNDDRAEAVRAFLVAGAIRLHRSRRVGPATATTMTFDGAEEAEATVMAPHSMLFHPSANIQDHFHAAEDLLVWAGVPDRRSARRLLDEGGASLPSQLIATLTTHAASWEVWLDRYKDSARAIETEFNIVHPRQFPDWPTLKELLADEIIPGTRVSVVNSDPIADDRPSYRATLDPESSQWNAPRDLCTIFVSGNVMARGLTLEGMTTALFQRSASTPLADTQMQMQRWFGYRGSYVELCRVFASSDQLSLFSAYHDTDEAIRSAIIERMMGGAPEPAVLQGHNFAATGKITSTRNYPLSPGARPFLTVLNSGGRPDPNAQLVADLFKPRPSSPLIAGGTVRGQILDQPLGLLEAADWLDQLKYDAYAPGTESPISTHWAQIEVRVAAKGPVTNPGLYRPPVSGRQGDPTRRHCPYAIAAYLRLWAASLSRPVRGLFVTGDPGRLWSMSDLQQKRALQPRFWVGIRFGDGQTVNSGPLSHLAFTVRATTKNVEAGELTTTWGASDPTAGPGQYRSDLYFDYYHRNDPLPSVRADSAWRPAGSDGQILIYINQHKGQPHPAIAVALCIPAGGPEQFAATRAGVLLN